MREGIYLCWRQFRKDSQAWFLRWKGWFTRKAWSGWSIIHCFFYIQRSLISWIHVEYIEIAENQLFEGRYRKQRVIIVEGLPEIIWISAKLWWQMLQLCLLNSFIFKDSDICLTNFSSLIALPYLPLIMAALHGFNMIHWSWDSLTACYFLCLSCILS